jgi:hypothetical protein
MKIAVAQSNYLPWKGYFDLIRSVDAFVLFDTAQYTRSTWRNRNLIKDPQGNIHWLTIPVRTAGLLGQPINQTRISDLQWYRRHWETIRHCYVRTPYFAEIREWLEPLYASFDGEEYLSRVNRRLLEALCTYLDIYTPILEAPEDLPPGKNERLINLCKRFGAAEYLSTMRAQSYLDRAAFRYEGIDVSFMVYDGYREYPQPGVFEHHLSVIDLLCRTGKNALRYLLPPQPALVYG